jgi:HSP20 family protein
LRRPDRPFGRIFDWFDTPEVFHVFEGVRPFDDRIRLEEEVVGDHLVIRAEMPGIDPAKDVEIRVGDGVLSVQAERRKEETKKSEGTFRSEFRYGSFRRTVPVPKGTSAKDVTATYRDGILEIQVPVPLGPTPAEKIAVTRGWQRARGSGRAGTGRPHTRPDHKEWSMPAHVGDQIRVRAHQVDEPDRCGEIIQVRGGDGGPPFVVRWDDSDHEVLFFPGIDALVGPLSSHAP